MTADQQRAEFGISAQPVGDRIVFTMGDEAETMTPTQAQRFAAQLAAAYVQAAGGTHRAHNGALVIGAPMITGIKRRIVRALRTEPLNQYQLAADLQEPPFRVRAELKCLKRDRLVTDSISPAGHLWELTARGVHQAYAADQTHLEGMPR